MTVFLAAFTGFNVMLALVAIHRALRLGTPQGRAWWASKRLYAIALVTAWTLPIVCVAATAGAWALQGSDAHWSGPAILAPTGWLVVMGTFFAIADIAEDGVLDFGRGSRRDISPK